MPRHVLVSLLSLVWFLSPACVLAAPVPTHLMPKDEPICWPTRVGDRMVHDINGHEIVNEVTKVEKLATGLAVTLEWVQTNGTHAPDQTVIVSDRGLQVIEYAGEKLDSPMWSLKLPHQSYNQWRENWMMGKQVWVMKTLGWEEVNVPAGTFRAIRVERNEILSSSFDEMLQSRTTYWYALGVGCIKWSTDDSRRVLKSFTPGKK